MRKLLGLSSRSLLIIASVCHGQAEAIEIAEVFRDGECTPYVQANFVGSAANLDSSGYNTSGLFSNSGDDTDSNVGFGGALGLKKEYDTFRVRPEFEVMWRQDSEHVTNSFPGPPGPITFFYDAKSSDNWSTLANLWLDVPVSEKLWLYGGGGLGAAGTHLTVDDTEVSGEKTASNFAWQAGGGFILPVGDRCELDLGYRFLDMGSTSVPLDGGTNGSYVADMASHNLMFSVRLYVP
jgi:opacity protein-like surface antigen